MNAPARLPEDVFAQVRARADIGIVVGRYVELRKAGRDLEGRCPFHGERTASFHVRPAEGYFHCFGCLAHGDVIDFVHKQTGRPVIDIVRELATEVGIAEGVPLPPLPPLPPGPGRVDLDFSATWETIAAEDPALAAAWLQDVRGVAPEALQLVESGFAWAAPDAFDAEVWPTVEVEDGKGRRGPLNAWVARRVAWRGQGVLAPVRSAATGQVVNVAMRWLTPTTLAGGKDAPKIERLVGVSDTDADGAPRGYGFAGAAPRAEVLVLVEGLVDALIAEALVHDLPGHVAAGTVNAGALAKLPNPKARHPEPARPGAWASWLPGRFTGRAVIIVPDLDKPGADGRRVGLDSAKAAAAHLVAAGVPARLFRWGTFFQALAAVGLPLVKDAVKDLGDVAQARAAAGVPWAHLRAAFVHTLGAS